MNRIKISIVLGTMGTLGLFGCAEPKIPVGDMQGARVPQILEVYAIYAQNLNGKTVGITEGARKVDTYIVIDHSRPYLTRTEVIKLVERELRVQAGVVVVHRDRKHIIFGLSGNADQRPALWLSENDNRRSASTVPAH